MKQLVKSTIMFITSLVLFTAVVYAWFASFDTSHIQPVNVSVSDGSPLAYEITYYTKDHVYKYDVSTNDILIYDESTMTFIPQDALPIDGPSYAFQQMFTGEFDPIIEEYNTENNVIVEITMAFNGDPVTLKNKIFSAPETSSEAVSLYPYTTSRPYYLSEVTQVQLMVSKDYNAYATGQNKFDVLNQAFDSIDVNQNLIYPMHSFYTNDVYTGILDLGNVELTTDVTSYKFYYNFSYDDTKINDIFLNENMSLAIDNLSSMVFFSDIKFSIMIGGNS